jgi:sRNA-binding carbon storage regulator CsrA
MLVLRRGRGQSIVIGENAEIVIKILNDEMGVISVGIDAPKSVRVDRFSYLVIVLYYFFYIASFS